MDRVSFSEWARGQSRVVLVAIAVRAALRAAPLVARVAREGLGPRQQQELSKLAGVIFRALASARVSVQDPDRIFISSALNTAGAADDESVLAIVVAEVTGAAMSATSAAANSAAAAAAANPDAPGTAAAAVHAFVDAFVSADASASDAEADAWNQIRSDIEAIQRDDVGALLDAPLWRQREPRWVRPAVDSLREALPQDEDWDIWIDWYGQRLLGGSPSTEYELVFASVPPKEWERGPTSANAWIKANLQRIEAGNPNARIDFRDRDSFEKWLEGQEPNVPVLLGTRAALRVLPASVRTRDVRSGLGATIESRLRGEAFRAVALARVSVIWPSNALALQPSLDKAARRAETRALSPVGVAADAADAARLRVTRSAARASAARAAEKAALILASEAGPEASQVGVSIRRASSPDSRCSRSFELFDLVGRARRDLGKQRLGQTSSDSSKRRRLGCLDRLVRRAPARRLAW